MLPRIVLTITQLAIGWTLGAQVRALIPINVGALDIFLTAVVIAVLVWLTGQIGALVLKDTPPPSAATLTACLVLALAFAALTLVPPVTQAVGSPQESSRGGARSAGSHQSRPRRRRAGPAGDARPRSSPGTP